MTKKVTIGVVIAVIVIGIFTSTKVFSLTNNKKTNALSTKEKLRLLGNINTKINYFKNNYIDRYISYKEKNKKLSNNRIVLEVNIGLDKEFYTNLKQSTRLSTNSLIVNKLFIVNGFCIQNHIIIYI